MSDHNQEKQDAAGRTKVREEQRVKGSPAQTGPGSGAGMGTDEGSGWAPKGERFGEEGGGSHSPEHQEGSPHKHPE